MAVGRYGGRSQELFRHQHIAEESELEVAKDLNSESLIPVMYYFQQVLPPKPNQTAPPTGNHMSKSL